MEVEVVVSHCFVYAATVASGNKMMKTLLHSTYVTHTHAQRETFLMLKCTLTATQENHLHRDPHMYTDQHNTHTHTHT